MWLYSEIESLADIPRYHGRVAPERTAVIDSRGKQSWRDLDATSSRIASALVASGVRPRQHIGFLGKNSSFYFELLFGANKAGAAIVPLNWRLAPAELGEIMADAECALVFVDREFEATLNELRRHCAQPFTAIGFDSIGCGPSEFDTWLKCGDGRDPMAKVDSRDTAILLYTSGTTGEPKGVQLTHRGFNYMRLCEHLEPALDWRDDDVILTVMPVFHLVGTGLSVQALYNGATVSLLPALDPGRLLQVLARDRPTICALVPTAIQMVLDHPDASSADFSSLRLMMYAGSPISSALLQRALTAMRCRFMQFYGATESGGALTLLRPEQHDVNNEARLRSCGTPLPLIEFRIVDADGRDVPEGAVGEFWVRTPGLFGGYWNRPQATAAVMRDGWYHTADAGFRDKDGLLYIVDRVKDMIITGGENVYSAEVEQALAKHPAVKQCAVIGLPDAKWGERVTAVIIPLAGAAATQEELIAHCRTLIAGYKVPKEVRFVQTLPMTSTGKILKRSVREQLQAFAQG